MKKIIHVLLIAAATAITASAQTGVRIGNLEITVRKTERDTVAEITLNEPGRSENETRPKRRPYRYRTTSEFVGIGFIRPDNGSNYYTILGGNSINIDVGGDHRYQLGRNFALGGVCHYSFYNYKLRNAASDPAFSDEIIGRTIDPDDIKKQVYRSNNIAAGVYARLYLVPPKQQKERHRRNDNYVEFDFGGKDGVYFDVGVQGDFAFGRYCKIKTRSSGKDRFHAGYAFNPFGASAFARVGIRRLTVYARYRMTDAFNRNALPLDLPPLTVGIVL